MTSLNNFVLDDLFVLYQCDTNAFVMDEHFFFVVDRFIVCIALYLYILYICKISR